ncbi:signal peptidase I [Sphingomonas sp.]|uniref:signal peptidase I n=1 Tax=Sphingomonas sp. TaxID=28214 RepID=UPI001852BC56|nr:signal peptidase I [Sphingomonas sp.]MBA3511410.1 signal peptidase I [Sphingomonas sp.]
MSWTRPRSRTRAERGAKGRDGGLLRFLLILALAAWAIRSFLVAPFSIPTGSMIPTLYVGDYLFVAKWPYGYSRYSFPFTFPSFDGRVLAKLPERGDVAVFRPPGAEMDFVKRVIAIPGDTIEARGGMLILNGRALSRQSLRPFAMPISPNSPCKVVPPARPFVITRGDGRSYCLYPAYRETLPGGPSYTVLDQVENPRADDFASLKVPPGHIFLMGDNRDDSLDSRFTPAEGGIGLVPIENLVGRGLVTFWSTDGSASYLKPWTWFTALRGSRIGNGYTGDPE